MHISEIAIENFRLLKNVKLRLDAGTTLIVGRNNSGKTSLTELFRRLLTDQSPRFRLEDFSLVVHDHFWTALEQYHNDQDEAKTRELLPVIRVELTIDYKENPDDFGPLGDFIIDLDPDCTVAKVSILCELDAGRIQSLFEGLKGEERPTVFKALRERIPKHFKAAVEAVDPNDATNRKKLEFSHLRGLLQVGFINAQRSLDDTSHGEKAVLGKILESLFSSAASEAADADAQSIAENLKQAVMTIQDDIDSNFNEQLANLLPAFVLFGYPGLSDPKLRTETVLEVTQLLSNHTTVGYEGANGIKLPESYNGLGPRNLIFILLKLFEFFRTFTSSQLTPKVHLVFIEEPEAHLHPQMQTVFIRKLSEISELFGEKLNAGVPWPAQFIVTTHSSHIANEASFDSMRYFRSQPSTTTPTSYTTEIKDMQTGLSNEEAKNREFLHKYMTLTRCDLLFADRAVLIEGSTERMLLPKMIEKVDEGQPDDEKLSSQYLSIMEVGGAYAHIFFNLLDFLDLRTLIITDLDTVDGENNGKKCRVSVGTRSSNACINRWYSGPNGEKPTKDQLLAKSETDKISLNRRITFQVPHGDGDACGRSFEDAFMLANPGLFGITETEPSKCEEQSWDKAQKVEKTDFALEHAIVSTDWVTPRYIEEGLRWLAKEAGMNSDDSPGPDAQEESESDHTIDETTRQTLEQEREKKARDIVLEGGQQ